jgi:chorismate synthase
MSGNSFGKIFSITTFGESHGDGIGAVIDGCPPGLLLSEEDIQVDLDRRKPGQSRYTTQRKESDTIQILSGVFEGITTGASIGLYVKNEDHKSKDYIDIKNKFRPGHADYSYYHKYGIRDYRGGGRSSARETVARVAAGAVARKYLKEKLNIEIYGYVSKVGGIDIKCKDLNFIKNNSFFIGDVESEHLVEHLISSVRKEGDSVGSEVTVVAKNVPVGLGEPVFDKLDADIAYAMMSINAVKAVALGDGFDVASQKGSQNRDEIRAEGFKSNHAGGVLGGISSGQDLFIKIAFKPTPSIVLKGDTVDVNNQDSTIITKGRHDPCVGIRGVPIAEAMLALVLMDHVMRDRAQNYDRKVR